MWITLSKDNYSKLPEGSRELILGRLKIGHILCPKCRQFFGIYKDEFHDDGLSRKPLFHACGLKSFFKLINWEDD